MYASPSFFTDNQTKNFAWISKWFFIFIWVAEFCYCDSCGQKHGNFNNKGKKPCIKDQKQNVKCIQSFLGQYIFCSYFKN